MISDGVIIAENTVDAISANEIDKVRRLVPPPICFGFGHPDFAANFGYWASMPRLSLYEATLLSLGADPKSLKEDRIAKLQKVKDQGKSIWDAYTSLIERHEIFRRCFHHTGFGYVSEGITSIKRWIDDLGIQVHPQSYEALEARTKPKELDMDVKDEPSPIRNSRGLTDQETETLFKLIAAMAVKGYAFDPDAERNQATADIQSDLDQLGVSLDQKTILKWVRSACDLLPKG